MVSLIWLKRFGNLRTGAGLLWRNGKIKSGGRDDSSDGGLGIYPHKANNLNLVCCLRYMSWIERLRFVCCHEEDLRHHLK
jgi:hypothetical protein